MSVYALGMRLSEFSTLTFDCYGTLIDWERGILDALESWRRRAGLQATDDELLEAFGQAEAQAERETPFRLYPQILEERARSHRGAMVGAGSTRATPAASANPSAGGRRSPTARPRSST